MGFRRSWRARCQSGKVSLMSKEDIEEAGEPIPDAGNTRTEASGGSPTPMVVLAIDDDLGMLKFYEAIVGEAGVSASVFFESSPIGPNPIAGPDLDLVLRVSVIMVSAAGPESRTLLARTA